MTLNRTVLGSAVVLYLLAPFTAAAQPVIHGAVALVDEGLPQHIPLSISGADFGDCATPLPCGAASIWMFTPTQIIVLSASCDSIVNPPQDACILEWQDDRVVARIPSGAKTARFLLFDADGTGFSEWTRINYYARETFDTSEQLDVPPGGLEITESLEFDAVTPRRLFTTREFHTELHELNPAIGRFTYLPIPYPDGSTTIFTTSIPPGAEVKFVQNAEDMAVDPRGRVWFPEAGEPVGSLSGSHNHARIVMYDPEYSTFCVYNVPGNHNETFGLAYEREYEPGKDRVWFTEAPRAGIAPSRLTWFNPDELPCDDGTFDFRPIQTGACANFVCEDASAAPCTADDDCGLQLCNTATDTCPNGESCSDDEDCWTCCEDCQNPANEGFCNDDVVGAGRSCRITDICISTAGVCLLSGIPCSQYEGCGNLYLDGNCQPTCGPGICENPDEFQALDGRPCNVDVDCALGAPQTCSGGHCYDGTSCSTDEDCLVAACPWDQTVPGCLYHQYDLPGVSFPAHLTIGEDGGLWFTDYGVNGWGNQIGRLDLTDPFGAFDLYKLPPANNSFGGGPWLVWVPPRLHGQTIADIMFTEHFDATIGRFDITRVGDPACAEPMGGVNECITETEVPATYVFEKAYDRHDTHWFTAAEGLAGYFNRSNEFVFLPPGWTLPFEVAQRKHATHLRAWIPNREASLAVDGNTDGTWANGSVTLTGTYQAQPWWEVDLGKLRPVGEIQLWACTDCPDTLENLHVMTLQSKEDQCGAPIPLGNLAQWQQAADWQAAHGDPVNEMASFWPPIQERPYLGPACGGWVPCYDDLETCDKPCGTTGRCQIPCSTDSDCSDWLCDTGANECYEPCLDDSDCDWAQECNTGAGRCFEPCVDDGDCGPGETCELGGQCSEGSTVSCTADSDCNLKICDIAAGTCFPPCASDADCKKGDTCDPSGKCVGRLQARYVRVQRDDSGVSLRLAEVQVFSPLTASDSRFGLAIDPVTQDIWIGTNGRKQIMRLRAAGTNLALGMEAKQDITYFPAFGPHLAVDGRTDGDHADVTLTRNAAQPWWQVDLGDVYDIAAVDVWACTGCGAYVLQDFYVLVSDEDFRVLDPANDLDTLINDPAVTSFSVPGAAGRPTVVQVNTTGRYVRVQVEWPEGTLKPMRLAEVDVTGQRIECTTDSECNDSVPCTEDVCRGGRCDNVCLVGDRWVDGVAVCTGGETCQAIAGTCTCSDDTFPFCSLPKFEDGPLCQ